MDTLKIISKNEQDELISTIPKEAKIVYLDGKVLQEKENSINCICEAFLIDINISNWDALNDVLGDSDCITNDVIYVFLNNYQLMFSDNPEFRNIVLSILSNNVEWWSEDVEKYVVDGKKKLFNVYLVD
ncbi:TPA: barstar family protein [Streptococcus suis]|nr:barstar family protein [Streptococcus suis]